MMRSTIKQCRTKSLRAFWSAWQGWLAPLTKKLGDSGYEIDYQIKLRLFIPWTPTLYLVMPGHYKKTIPA